MENITRRFGCYAFFLFFFLSCSWATYAAVTYIDPTTGELSPTPVARTYTNGDYTSFPFPEGNWQEIKVYFQGEITEPNGYISIDLGGEGSMGYKYWHNGSPRPLTTVFTHDLAWYESFDLYLSMDGTGTTLTIEKIELIGISQPTEKIISVAVNPQILLVQSGLQPATVRFSAELAAETNVQFYVRDPGGSEVYVGETSGNPYYPANIPWQPGYEPGIYTAIAQVGAERKETTFTLEVSQDQFTGIGNGSDNLDPLSQFSFTNPPPSTFDPSVANDSSLVNSFPIDDPVNILSGNFLVPESDLTLKSRLPLLLARFYNSLDTRVSPFGRGWSSPFFSRLEFLASDVVFVNYDGSRFFFRAQDGEFISPPRSAMKLSRSASDNIWYISNPHGGQWRFTPTGALLSISLASNPASLVSFSYDGEERLQRVSNPAGQWFEFSYQDDLVIGVTDSSGRRVSYAYSDGNLTTFTDPLNRSTSYEYTADGLMTLVTRPGGLVTTVSYNDGRVSSVTHPNGQTSTFEWSHDPNRLVYVDPSGVSHVYGFTADWRIETYETTDYSSFSKVKTLVSSGSFLVSSLDTQGTLTNYSYDQNGLLSGITDALGNTRSFVWHPSLVKVVKKTDPLGREWRYFWNDIGKLASVTNPLGQTGVLAYDAFGNCVSYTDPAGKVTRYEYDQGGNQLLKIVDPNEGQTSFSYDSRGNLLTFSDPLQRVTAYEYDAADRLTKTSYPDGRFVCIQYDEAGNLSLRRDNLGHETTYEYDAERNLRAVVRPDNSRLEFGYDSLGRLVSRTDPLGRVTTYEYDPSFGPGSLGKVTKISHPDGSFETLSYNSEGWLFERRDELGNVTQYEFDILGRLLAEIDPAGNRWESVFDQVGNRLTAKDPLNRVTGFEYDGLDRVVKIVKPDGTSVSFSYDFRNNLTALTNELGDRWSWEYDALGRPVKAIQPNGASATYLYDLAGQLQASVNPLGFATQYIFDRGGRLSSLTAPNGGVYRYYYDPVGRLASFVTPLNTGYSYEYDSMDRLVSTTDPLGQIVYSEFDEAGQLLAVIDALSRRTVMTYDDRGRLLSKTNPEGGTMVYGYDSAGNRVSLTDADNRVWRWEYDALGRVVRELNPLGSPVSFGYDPVGNLVSKTNARNQTIQYAFDALDRLIQVNYPDIGLATFAYDAAGRETVRSGASGWAGKTWDSVNNLTSETFGPWGKTWRYSYDSAGNRVRAVSPEGGAYSYEYNPLGLLTRLNPSGKHDEIAYVYDLMGRLLEVQRPGVKTNHSYDPVGRLLEIRHLRDSGRERLIAGRTYTYDLVGNVSSFVDEKNRRTSFFHNGADWLTRVMYPDGQVVSYDYGLAGDRLAETREIPMVVGHGRNARLATNTQVILFGYDPAGRLISRASDTFQYDPDGNLISELEAGVKTDYEWSSANRLLKMERTFPCHRHGKHGCGRCSPDVIAEEFGYLPEDWRRITRKIGGLSFFSAYDGDDESHEYALTPAFLHKEWKLWSWCWKPKIPKLVLHREFVSGPAADDLETTRYRGRSLSHLKDSIGSTIALANRGGNVVARLDYDAFGSFRWPDKPGHGVPPCRETDIDGYLDRLEGKHSFGLPQWDEWHFGRHHGKTLTPYLFAGRRYQYGSNQYFNRNRQYDPRVGRFTSSDPIGFNGGDNLYVYADNRPAVLTDPYGFAGEMTLERLPSVLEIAPALRSFMAKAQSSWASAGLTSGLSISAAALGIVGTVGTAVGIVGGSIIINTPMDTQGTISLPYPGQQIQNQNITVGKNPTKNKQFVSEAGKADSTVIMAQGDGGKKGQGGKLPRYEGPKPKYIENPQHIPGQGLRPGKTPLPKDAGEAFKNAVPDNPLNPKNWFGKGADGKVYRFSTSNDGTVHFSGMEGVGDGIRNITKYALDRLSGL